MWTSNRTDLFPIKVKKCERVCVCLLVVVCPWLRHFRFLLLLFLMYLQWQTEHCSLQHELGKYLQNNLIKQSGENRKLKFIWNLIPHVLTKLSPGNGAESWELNIVVQMGKKRSDPGSKYKDPGGLLGQPGYTGLRYCGPKSGWSVFTCATFYGGTILTNPSQK